MKRFVFVGLSCLFLLIGCVSKEKKTDNAKDAALADNETESAALKIDFPIYDFEELKPLLNREDDKTYIVNFWASWCKPCIAELPYFEQTFAEQKENGVELILVNLDMRSMWEKRLVPFVKEKDLKGRVVILDDPKMNDWIPKVDENWGGGIPATLIYNKNNRAFFERGFTYQELNDELKNFIN